MDELDENPGKRVKGAEVAERGTEFVLICRETFAGFAVDSLGEG